MSQPTFALPDQSRYDHATPSSLGTDVQVGGSCTHASSCSSIHTQLQVQLTTHVLQDIQSKFIFTLIGHSFEPTKHVKWEA